MRMHSKIFLNILSLSPLLNAAFVAWNVASCSFFQDPQFIIIAISASKYVVCSRNWTNSLSDSKRLSVITSLFIIGSLDNGRPFSHSVRVSPFKTCSTHVNFFSSIYFLCVLTYSNPKGRELFNFFKYKYVFPETPFHNSFMRVSPYSSLI